MQGVVQREGDLARGGNGGLRGAQCAADAAAVAFIVPIEARKIEGDEWTPGKNCPFDPIASKKAQENGMTVICAGGKNIPNIEAILNDKTYIGTTIK